MADELGTRIEETQSAIQRARNHLTIDTQSYVTDNETRAIAKQMTERSGKLLTPENHQYVGSAVVHVYEKIFNEKEMACISYTGFSKAISEVQAGLAMDELRRKLMSAYGRSPVGK